MRIKSRFYGFSVLVLAFIFCFFKLERNSLTLDEVSTINISKNWFQMLGVLWFQEGNTWLYSVLMNLWINLGEGEWILRAFSSFFAVLTVPVFYLLAKEINGLKTARIATVLLVTNLYFVFYAQTARVYSFALFLTVLFSLFFIRFSKNTKSYKYIILYSLSCVFAIYSYLLVGLIIATQYISLLFLPKRIPLKMMTFSIIGIFLCLIPLILSPSFEGGHQLDWLQKPPLVHLVFSGILYGGDSLIVTAIFAYVVISFLWSKRDILLKRSRESFHLYFLLLWSSFPVLFTFIFSWLVKPIFQPEYFNTSFPGFILLVALGLNRISKKRWIYLMLLGGILAFSIIRLMFWYGGNNDYGTVIENRSPRDWRAVAEYVEKHAKTGDGIIFYSYYVRYPFDYYFEKTSKKINPDILEISSTNYPLGGGTRLPKPNLDLIHTLNKKHSRIWLVLSYNNFSWLNRKSQWVMIEEALMKNYKLKEEKYFNQVEVKLFIQK